MLDVMSGGRLVAGFPVGTPMDTTLLLRRSRRRPCARSIARACELILRAWSEPERVLVQRQVHPASLRQHLAAPDAEAASAGLGAGRRQRRDLGSVPGERLPLRLPVLLRLPGGPEDDGRLLGTRSTGTSCRAIPTAPASCSSSPSPTDDAEAERLYAEPALYFYQRCLHVYAGLRQSAGLHVDGHAARPASRGRSRASPTAPARGPRWRRCRGRTWSSAATSSPAARRRSPTASTTWPTSSTSAT